MESCLSRWSKTGLVVLVGIEEMEGDVKAGRCVRDHKRPQASSLRAHCELDSFHLSTWLESSELRNYSIRSSCGQHRESWIRLT